MITKEKLQNRHDNRLNSYLSGRSSYASQPQPLYSYNSFNNNNWNGGDGVIRQFTKWLEYHPSSRFASEFDYLGYGYEIVCNWNCYEDVTYTTIISRKYRHEIEVSDEEEWTYDTYLITYYKDRGKTETIQLNGKVLNVDGYIQLLNIIEAAGYKFDFN